jgi:hypothetical protein
MLLKSVVRGPNKFMWAGADALTLDRYLHAKEVMGMAPKDAVDYTHQVMDSYHVPPTLFGRKATDTSTAGGLDRLARQWITEPAVSLFGAYSYGLLNTFAHQVGGMIKKNATPLERANSAASLLILAGLTSGAGTYLYQGLTGRPSEVQARGQSKILQDLSDAYEGKQAYTTAVGKHLWTPSVPAQAGWEMLRNQDFAGRKIVKPGDNPLEQASETADYFANQYASPLKPMLQAAQGQLPGEEALKQFGERNIGITPKSPASQAYDANRNARNAAASRKNQGPLEQLIKEYGG